MLPARLLDLVREGDLIRPRWLGTRDHSWVTALADLVQARVGQPRGALERSLSELELPEAPPLARRAMTHVLLRRHGFVVRARVAPARTRELVFPLAAARPELDRDGVLTEAARQLGLAPGLARDLAQDLAADDAPDELARCLHADRPRFRVLSPLERSPSVQELLERYHLSLAQGMLLRAAVVRARLDEQVRPVVRFARLQGLMIGLSAAPARGARVELELSGPLSLFRHATRYGRALARWLPALTRAPRWSLEARCVVHGEAGTMRLSHRDPLGTTHAPPRRFDSALEERLFRDLQAIESGWRVLREGRPVRCGAQLAFPDFVLVHEATGRAVPVEVVGYWTPGYLDQKLSLLAALPEGERWITCLDERLSAAAGDRVPERGLLRFRGRVDAAAVLREAERLAGAAAGAG